MKTYIYQDENVESYNLFELPIGPEDKKYFTDEECDLVMSLEVPSLSPDYEEKIKQTIKNKFDHIDKVYDENGKIFNLLNMDKDVVKNVIRSIRFSKHYAIYKSKITTKTYMYFNLLDYIWKIITGKVFDKQVKEIYSIILKYKNIK